ncbi:MAG: metallophosphoesterase [Anaerolineae bacterium]
MSPIFVMGDIHGHYDRMIEVLRDDAQLIRRDLTWIGGEATVCFLGDYFDRGPDGIRVVDFLISLEIQAEMNGGKVISLLGNHDVFIMAAQRFGTRQGTSGGRGNFYEDWRHMGGVMRDLESLTPEHIAWLTNLPALALLEDRVMAHADSLFYMRYGSTLEEINAHFVALLRGYDFRAWDRLLNDFSDRYAFMDKDGYGDPTTDGVTNAERFMEAFGGRQILHGHTPIFRVTGQAPERVTEPYLYAEGLCMNFDPGMYAGGPGFIYELPSL